MISPFQQLLDASKEYLAVTLEPKNYEPDDYEIAKQNLIFAIHKIESEGV